MERINALRRRVSFGPRIGLYVGAEWIGVTVVRGSEVEWSLLESVGPNTALDAAITPMLEKSLTSLRVRWPRPRVWIAIDTPQSRMKTVRGLPTVADTRVMTQLLAATPDRFFVGSPGGVVVAKARIVAPGVVESAAFDIAMLEAIQRGCLNAGLEVVLYGPATVAIPGEPDDAKEDDVPTALIAARGVTQLLPGDPLTVQRRWIDTGTPLRRRSRLAAAGVAASLTLGVALATPAILALRASRTARHVIATLAPARAKALSAERDVASMTAALTTVRLFETGRTSKTLLLAQLTQTLPSTAVITSLTVDTAATTAVVLAPHAADVVHAIEEMLGATHVEMIGPVTREFVTATSPPSPGGNLPPTEMERVTVRFRLAPEGATAREPLGVTE